MDPTCYKCGAIVEEGAPFCPNCRAPQIRVQVPGEERAPDTPATPPFPPGTPEQIQPPAQPVPLTAHRIRLRDAWGPAAAAAVVMIVCWKVLPPALLVVVIGGGALAVMLYRRRRPEIRLTNRSGARIGMFSGLLAFAFVFISLLVDFLGNGGATFRAAIQQWARQQPANDPNVAEMLQWLNRPDNLATAVVIWTILLGLILVGLSSLGGLIGARLSRRKNPQ